MIEGMFDNGAIPVLERVVQFTSARHKLISHNVANFSTPNFRPKELSVEQFQQTLGEAVDRRRRAEDAEPLKTEDTAQLEFRAHGIETDPQPSRENLLFHDRNDRSVEHMMQKLAENTMTHNNALRMIAGKFDMLQSTIRERA